MNYVNIYYFHPFLLQIFYLEHQTKHEKFNNYKPDV